MDMTWITDRLAVGGGIWTDANMREVVRAGVTHIIDMQIEFDDTDLAAAYSVEVLWLPVDDDFKPKRPDLFHCGAEFALRALDDPNGKLFVHCAAGVHRGPMMALAVLRVLGWSAEEAMDVIVERRPVVDFAEVYVRSVENFMRTYVEEEAGR
jgi:protein-tyrosine phosphatase